MPRLIAKSFVILLLTLTVGGNWALLQSVAWVGMVVNYSRDASLSEALQKTFDGQHPCKLCKLAAAEKHAPQKQAAQLTTAKIDFFLGASPLNFFPPCVDRTHLPLFVSMRSRAEVPPLPPPRQLLG